MEEIKNFIYSHSSPNGCVALTRSERDELVRMVEELSNSVTELTNTKTELENKVTELDKQIEKMKNCQNCKHDYYRVCISKIRCENLEQWECKE